MQMQDGKHKAVGLFDGPLGERIKPRFDSHPDIDVIATRDDKAFLEDLPNADVDLVMSAGYRHIIPEEIIEGTDARFVNAHISYLPYGKGANPNVWSIADDEPAGVTIHEITPKVDDGPIISQRRVPKYPDDNARDLYERLLSAMDGLVIDTIDSLLTGEYDTRAQPQGGSFHYSAEFDDLCELDLETKETAGETIRKLRALTFDPYDNAYFERGDDRYYVSIKIERDD